MTEIEIQETTPETKVVPPANVRLPPSPPPKHPETLPLAMPGGLEDTKDVTSTHSPDGDVKVGTSESQSPNQGAHNTQKQQQQHSRRGSTFLSRAFSTQNRASYKRFFSAYAQTWLGLSPLWLMGEALVPGARVGTQFNKGRKKLVDAAEDVRKAVATSASDVVIIVDEKFQSAFGKSAEGKDEGEGRKLVERTAEVLKAAGENAILVVTTSLEKLSSSTDTQSPKSKSRSKLPTSFDLKELASSPALRASIQKHGRDALVLLDSALHHPVVVTGVADFARTRGIPHADALLRLASLGLQRILKNMPVQVPTDVRDEVQKMEANVEAHIEEIDAEELERRSTQEERDEASKIGEAARNAPDPKVEGNAPSEGEDPYETMRKRTQCLIM